MKFTESQLAFLSTKIIVDESFISEAAVFKVKRKPRTVVISVIPTDDREPVTTVSIGSETWTFTSQTTYFEDKHGQ
jgi:hypothetical protein